MRDLASLPDDRETCRRLAEDADRVLGDEVLAPWFPRAVDPGGGFHQAFSRQWRREEPHGERSVVFQARMTWVAAAATQHVLAGSRYAEMSRHGFACLAETLWDRVHGGFFWAVNHDGPPATERKHAYGLAFGIYAAVEHYRASRDTTALALAQQAFGWLDHHGHDDRYGGYFELFERDGSPVGRERSHDVIGTPTGYKSLNGHLHLLEALTALAVVWPDATVRERLVEVFTIVRDRAAIGPGALASVFDRAWRPVAARQAIRGLIAAARSWHLPAPRYPQSHGHNLEAAFLLDEAAQQLGVAADAKTQDVIRALVDRALADGFDHGSGGFVHVGRVNAPGSDPVKIWWVQAEALNALLLLHERHGRDVPTYWNVFVRTWLFIRDHHTDRENGGWHARLAADGRPEDLRKSDAWTDPYHQTRALLNMSRTLRRLAAR